MSFFSEDVPVRLSLRERMALKEAAASNNSDVTPRDRKIKSDSIQQYRKSRDIEDEIEKTTRRVVRITDDGKEEVKVRERKYQNGEKEQVVKRLSRENENKMAIAEDKEENEAEDVNNNDLSSRDSRQSQNTRRNDSKNQDIANGDERSAKREKRYEEKKETVNDDSFVRRIRRRRRDVVDEEDVKTNERNKTDDKLEITSRRVDRLEKKVEDSSYNEETVIKKSHGKGKVEEHTKTKKTRHYHDNGADVKEVTEIKVETSVTKDSDNESETKIVAKIINGDVTKHLEKKSSRHHHDDDTDVETVSITNIDKISHADNSVTESEVTTLIETCVNPSEIKNGGTKNTSNNEEIKAHRFNRAGRMIDDLDKDTANKPVRVNKRPEPRSDIKPKSDKLAKRSIVIEDVIAKENEQGVESCSAMTEQEEEVNEVKNVKLRNKFEPKDRPASVGNFKSRFENKDNDKTQTKRPLSVGNVRAKFDQTNKAERKSRNILSNKGVNKTIDEDKELEVKLKETVPKEEEQAIELKDTKNNNLRNKYEKNARPTSVVDFKSKFEPKTQQKRPLSTGTFPSKFGSTSSKSGANELQDKLGRLNGNKNVNFKNKFEGNQNKRPVSVGNFRSKFEPKSSDNTESERPLSVGNFHSKTETKDNKPEDKENKITENRTYEKPSREDKKIIAKNTTVKDDENGRTLESVTKLTKGHGQSAQEISQIKKVETSDKGGMHIEKVTTVSETKTATGKYTRRTIETKIEANPEKKANAPSKSMEAIMKERKQKQEAAKKSQANRMAKGKNMFKQMDANAQVGQKVTVNSGGGAANSNIEKLLKWIAKRINQYPAVHVSNFTSSWEDGIAMCALMNYLLGDKAINPLAVSTTDKRKNFHMAIKAATDAGVPALLDADELADHELDRRSMITYLHLVYKILFADKQEIK
ncbi:repetitive organellar protein-like isoform X2 [Hydractinia symbiolongicarpus]|uniref:repetitive organellar protein-like isoform X2 n=1 Tax=Hydractinia symbiolongicarpus TaxID=13093 RepID=UPI00254B7208|nr:repetitive organellar protein-like isoform X2 [Hydractinia symbiolongicarpus]